MFCSRHNQLKLFPILVVVCILLSACGTKSDIERICESYEDAIKEEIGLDDSTGLNLVGVNSDDYPELKVLVILEEPIQPDDFLEKARDITSNVKSIMDDSGYDVGALLILLVNGDKLAKYWDTTDYVSGTFTDYFDHSEPETKTNVTLDELISEQEDSNR